MKNIFIIAALLSNCSGEKVTNFYKVKISNEHFASKLNEFIIQNKLDDKKSIVRVVFLETVSHQYMYVSPSHFKPNYKYFEPEGWLISNNVLVLVCQNGNFYQRSDFVKQEIDREIKTLSIKLAEPGATIVEPDGTRYSYCIKSKKIEVDNVFDKLPDDECH